MNESPLTILVAEQFADTIVSHLHIPHTLLTFSEYGDETMRTKLKETDVFVSSMVKASWISADSRLQLIQGVGAGIEGIATNTLPPGCVICNVFGHGQSVAEYVFMVMAVLNRDLVTQDAELRQGRWGGGSIRNGLPGRTLLVVGLGHIGAELVRWGQFMGMAVIGLTRSPSPERMKQLGLVHSGGFDALLDMLPQADFVVVAIPHTVETNGFIGEKELACLNSSTFLINVARGPVVDEASLFTALKERKIAGAAIDVWYSYPDSLNARHSPATYPFHELDNVIMTPHNSGYTDRTMNYRFQFIADNIHRLAAGEALKNIVWPG